MEENVIGLLKWMQFPLLELSDDETNDNYLIQGERIMGLIRQKKINNFDLKVTENQDILDFYRCSFDIKGMFKPITRCIRKKMNDMTRESFLDEGIPFLYSLTGIYREEISISLPDEPDEGCKHSNRYNKTEMSYKVEIKNIGTFYLPVICKERDTYIFLDGLKYYRFKEVSIIAILAVMNRFYQAVQSLKTKNVTFICELENQYLELYQYNWRVGAKDNKSFEKKLLEQGYSIENGIYTIDPAKETIDMELLLDRQCKLSMLYDLQQLHQEGVAVRIQDYLVDKKSRHKIISIPSYYTSMLYKNMTCLLALYKNIEERIKYKTNLGKHIATARVTKKNIPYHILKSMEQSKFNEYFGYVEFDESIDLKKAAIIEEECMFLMKNVFSNHRYEKTILRIRKLGKHHAKGLYYPGFNTLCIDIRYPDSYAHEYFHLIDDQNGELSLQYEFHKVVQKYKEIINKNISKLDTAIQSKLYGNTKYNLSYYFMPAEIFARCGEIYLSRICNVTSSLLTLEEGNIFCYPEDDMLQDEIKKYYDGLLKGGFEDETIIYK